MKQIHFRAVKSEISGLIVCNEYSHLTEYKLEIVERLKKAKICKDFDFRFLQIEVINDLSNCTDKTTTELFKRNNDVLYQA